MAVGQIYVLPNGGAQLVNSPGGQVHPSLAILNPNDGVVYVAINRPVPAIGTTASWDYKVPSQSYALLPGTWQNVGIYYLDQSGAGRNGEITIYPLQERIRLPMFQSIGRALQVVGSAMDVTESVQPANPGAGILRLWADNSDVLHGLDSAGTDESIISTRTALGGVLTGTLPNPSIGNSAISDAMLAGGIQGSKLVAGSVNTAQLANGAVDTTQLAGRAAYNILSQNVAAADIWNSVALAAGDNGIGFSCTFTPAATDNLVFAYFTASALLTPPLGANTACGWVPYVDGSPVANGIQLPLNYVLVPNSGPGVYVSFAGYVYLGNGYSLASHTFSPRFRNSVATSSGAYLRAGTNPLSEYIGAAIFIAKR